jgi:hypothetical protein
MAAALPPAPWSAIGDRDELADSFKGWDPRVTGLLETVESCFWWACSGELVRSQTPVDLGLWSFDLAGRCRPFHAAHPMLPHLGLGANQAIEDGTALAVMLEGLTTNDSINAASSPSPRHPSTYKLRLMHVKNPATRFHGAGFFDEASCTCQSLA